MRDPWTIGCRVVLSCCLLLFSAGCRPAPDQGPSGAQADGARPAATGPAVGRAVPTRSIDEQRSFPVAMRSQEQCAFLAPDNWGVDVGPQSSGIDIYNATKTMFASYLVYPVNTAIGPYAWGYPPPMNDPDRYSADPKRVIRALLRPAVVQHGGAADMDFTADPPESIPPYTAVTLRGSTHSALVIFTAIPGDAQNYVIPIRAAIMANAHWPEMTGALARMALSIRCTVQLRVPSGDDADTRVGRRRGKDDEGDEAGYNPWRGSEYVHDAGTGQNYIVTSKDWSDTGPDGPGYYKRNGNDWTKLSPGRSR